jgi:voltage-gated potassium channel Kch
MALITMPLSTYVIINNHEIYARVEPYLERFKSDDRIETELGVNEDHAVIVGYDQLVVESLDAIREHFDEVVLVDRGPENVDVLQNADFEYIYGDFRHGEIRQEADVENAAFVLSMATQTEINRQLLDQVRDDATTFVAAGHAEDAALLYEHGADYVILRQVLAGEILAEHVTDYLTDRESFDAMIDRTRDHLSGGDGDGR